VCTLPGVRLETVSSARDGLGDDRLAAVRERLDELVADAERMGRRIPEQRDRVRGADGTQARRLTRRLPVERRRQRLAGRREGQRPPRADPVEALQSAPPPALSSSVREMTGASSSLRMSNTTEPSVVGTSSASP